MPKQKTGIFFFNILLQFYEYDYLILHSHMNWVTLWQVWKIL
ncbi:hypothetical protein XSR1_110018 [Xenorhabdus szentirmaii DSM 16338]|uniref:Uncharacterized protein n=1 Tax=Xenorhabdus szentirmaii DSM 16338 TaxID=1427518 RepID=W1IV91_9GAMM|nr:hypothetical protein XSR1_110018 [Xenorhabdus szentirmaii DSM 16338]